MKRFDFLFPFLVVLLFGLALLLTSGSWLIARKVGALLIMPMGAIWMLGLAACAWPKIRTRPRLPLLALWIAYSVAGSPYVGVLLLRQLEKPFYAYEEVAEPLDALVLLGGGTILSPGGNPALGTHGDRILRPATLYHQGMAPVLITTGRSVTEIGEDRLLSRETAALWEGVGVPASAIIPVDSPRNTAEELDAIRALLEQHPEWETVGLCSSASHLRRAFRQSRARGLEFVPVPCDFRSTQLPLTPLYLVPQGRGFRDVQTALWEYLGGLF